MIDIVLIIILEFLFNFFLSAELIRDPFHLVVENSYE